MQSLHLSANLCVNKCITLIVNVIFINITTEHSNTKHISFLKSFLLLEKQIIYVVFYN